MPSVTHTAPANLATHIEELFATLDPQGPGAAVLVVHDSAVLYRRGFGLANLELGVPMEPHMVLRIGSITKQFTAVAILMLAQEGKLSLDDPITRFLPDYPTQGHVITVEHLLTHTSGIKSYTNMPEWLALWRNDMSPPEIIALFKDQPLEFAPGQRWAYNNSAYILLGVIVEQASGTTYEAFLRERVFGPLGMTHSSSDHTERVVPGRVPGYQKGDHGYENAPYLSMTQPYAAGALLSSVDDLALWDAALYGETLLPRDALQRAWTPAVLADGTATGYGYGWELGAYEGHSVVEHGGGIPGFVAHALRLPDDRLFVAVLTNSAGGDLRPDRLAIKIAAAALGSPYHEPTPVALDPAMLDRLVGVYAVDEKTEQVVTRSEGGLIFQRSGGAPEDLAALSPAEFYFTKDPFARLSVSTDAAGAVTGLHVGSYSGPAEVATRTDRPLPQERQVIGLDPATYDRLVGVYQIAPGFVFTVSREGAGLFGQATGQQKIEMFPQSATLCLLKVVDAQIEFVPDAAGMVTSLILHQGGQHLPAPRIS